MLYAGLCILTAGVDPSGPEIASIQEPPAQVQEYKEVCNIPTSQERAEVVVN